MNWQKFVFFTISLVIFTISIFFNKWPDNFFSTHKRGTWNHVKYSSSHVNSTFHNLLFSHKMKIPPVKFTFSHVNGMSLYVIGIFSHVDLNFQRCKQSMQEKCVSSHWLFFICEQKNVTCEINTMSHVSWTFSFHTVSPHVGTLSYSASHSVGALLPMSYITCFHFVVS